MSGSTSRLKGSAGACVNSVWFAPVPDRLSCMGQGNFVGGSGINITSGSPANLVSLWTPYNTNMLGGSNVVTASFGAATSAPDGTTNGKKLVEAATSTIHACEATFVTNQNNFNSFAKSSPQYTMRVSVFAKAGERTRFALYFGTGQMDQNNGGVVGCKTIFDLANGQIGVANTAFGSPTFPFSPGPTEIVPFGNGWFRCTMDAVTGSQPFPIAGYMYGIILDNGSGTGAESTSYSGDGSSGAYFWKTTSLPPAAWALNNVAFFDDFTSLSTVDTGDTRSAGFNWYIHNTWPNFPGDVPSTGSKFSISSPSILKITAPSGQQDLAMSTAGSNGNTTPASSFSNTFVGRVFQTPMLAETSVAFRGDLTAAAGHVTLWTQSIEGLVGNPQLNGCEVDFFEDFTNTTKNYPGTTVFAGDSTEQADFILNAGSGYPIWYSTFNYQNALTIGDQRAAADGQQLYSSLVGNNLNNTPHLTVGVDWSVHSLSPATGLAGSIPYANQTYVDRTQQHVYSCLWLSSRGYDAGHVMQFFDGLYTGAPTDGMTNQFGHGAYAGTSEIHVAETLHYPIFFGTPTNIDVFIDWIKVTQ